MTHFAKVIIWALEQKFFEKYLENYQTINESFSKSTQNVTKLAN